MVKIGVLKERAAGEQRVALVPEAVASLVKEGFEILIETGAGEQAFFADRLYAEAGAAVAADASAVAGECEAVLKVQAPSIEEIATFRRGAILVALLTPADTARLEGDFAERQITAFSLNRLPRTTRAQTMDALSSQSTIAGYKAVLLGAASFGKLFPMLVTAAGTLIPAKILIVGAGVAGLQAIATARRLGAIVTAFDVRPAVKEQVESLGARFLSIQPGDEETEAASGYAKVLSDVSMNRVQEGLRKPVSEADIVITSAQVPGERAPLLIPEQTLTSMKPGSVIVDLAAETGGNCALTVPGETVVRHAVTIHAPVNLPATVPTHASQMYARNVTNFLMTLVKDGALQLSFDDEVIRATCVTHQGKAQEEQ